MQQTVTIMNHKTNSELVTTVVNNSNTGQTNISGNNSNNKTNGSNSNTANSVKNGVIKNNSSSNSISSSITLNSNSVSAGNNSKVGTQSQIPTVPDAKAKQVLKEAVDAVVNSFAKHTQGYGRGGLEINYQLAETLDPNRITIHG